MGDGGGTEERRGHSEVEVTYARRGEAKLELMREGDFEVVVVCHIFRMQ